MNELTTKKYWEETWKGFKPRKIEKNYIFFDLLKKYLPTNSTMKCLEIGCAPGRFLVAFHKNFEYELNGIDMCGIEVTKKNLEFNGIKNYNLYETDFLKWQTKKKFDVVSSFGYIEHFKDPTSHLKKMIELVAKGGYLVVEIPSFRYINSVTRSLFSHDNGNWKKIHNLRIMDTEFWKNRCEEFGLKTVYLGHYKFFSYWHESKNKLARGLNIPLVGTSLVLNKITDALNLNIVLANKYSSPFIVLIAKKNS
ncbi:class I SAM-dependent methyltransferase [Patescibacteria group bacterium]|nr:class I SAM-dependent methyltransferase [Candidatus Micrarchaeota archaeon]MBU1758362.1 class I SAM-dependent methyltransferase [Patescibacteria group bacterium]